MDIEPNSEGWSFSSEDQTGLFHLVHDGSVVIALFESVGITSTQNHLFIGTEQECQNKIIELGLTTNPE